jgi:uncharacterized protein YjbI with pentapeptide repeats
MTVSEENQEMSSMAGTDNFAFTVPRVIKDKIFKDNDFSAPGASNILFISCHFENISLSHCHFHELRFEQCTMTHLSLKNVLCEKLIFTRCQLDIAINDSKGYELCFHECQFNSLQSHCSTLEEITMHHTCIDSGRFINNVISQFIACDLKAQNCILKEGELRDFSGYQCHFINNTWQQVLLTRQVMGDCTLDGCQFIEIKGLNRTWFNCQLKSCEFINLSLEQSSFHRSVLQACSFKSSRLSGTVLCECQFLYTNFNHASLESIQGEQSYFSHCDLRYADFTQANLVAATFAHCDLGAAIIAGADLRAANFQHQPLQSTALENCRLHGANFMDHLAGTYQQDTLLEDIAHWYQTYHPGPKSGADSKKTGVINYV